MTGEIEFTKREGQILTLLSKGMRQQEIADVLELNFGTVKNYIHEAKKKYGIKTTIQLVAVWISQNTPEPEPVVWTGVIEANNGETIIYAGHSEQSTLKQMADWCRENWDYSEEEMKVMPKGDNLCLEVYMSYADNEFYMSPEKVDVL